MNGNVAQSVILNADELINEAKTSSGLDRFGGDKYLHAFRILCQSLEQEGRLNALGRGMWRQRLLEGLLAQLRIEEWYRRHPEIDEEEIINPVVIAGLQRTGSTLLHRTVAAAPGFIAPLWYETRFPSPDLDWDFTFENDARIPKAKAEVAAMLEVNPDLLSIHPMDAMAPDEEIMLLENAFYSYVPTAYVHVPTYTEWAGSVDNTPGYEYLARILKFLQWQKRKATGTTTPQQWILKAPHHLHFMDVLLNVFPDAKVVLTHRDPVNTIPSVCSMHTGLFTLCSDDVDPLEVSQIWTDLWQSGINTTMRVREKNEASFHDVYFKDTVNSPVDVVRGILNFVGKDLTEDAKREIEKWRESNRRELRPPHEYTLEQFGLTEEGLKEKFAGYRERYITNRS